MKRTKFLALPLIVLAMSMLHGCGLVVSTYVVEANWDPNMGNVTGTGTFNSGATVALTATPHIGFKFVDWREGDNVVGTSPVFVFWANGNRTLTATFAHIQYHVAVSYDDTMGTVTGTGFHNSGDMVTLTATPLVGFAFVNWTEGEDIVSTDKTFTFVASNHRTLTAVFVSL